MCGQVENHLVFDCEDMVNDSFNKASEFIKFI